MSFIEFTGVDNKPVSIAVDSIVAVRPHTPARTLVRTEDGEAYFVALPYEETMSALKVLAKFKSVAKTKP